MCGLPSCVQPCDICKYKQNVRVEIISKVQNQIYTTSKCNGLTDHRYWNEMFDHYILYDCIVQVSIYLWPSCVNVTNVSVDKVLLNVCFRSVEFTVWVCSVYRTKVWLYPSQLRRLMITLIETKTGTPHHCQESGISIHAVTPGGSKNKKCDWHISRKSPATRNYEAICYRWHGDWYQTLCLRLLGNAIKLQRRSDLRDKTVHKL